MSNDPKRAKLPSDCQNRLAADALLAGMMGLMETSNPVFYDDEGYDDVQSVDDRLEAIVRGVSVALEEGSPVDWAEVAEAMQEEMSGARRDACPECEERDRIRKESAIEMNARPSGRIDCVLRSIFDERWEEFFDGLSKQPPSYDLARAKWICDAQVDTVLQELRNREGSNGY